MKSQTSSRVLDITVTAMLIAMVFVATLMLNIKLPIAANGGLIHLGTALLFMASILFGPKKGAIAGAVGMGLLLFVEILLFIML
ncbi:ECF transporter S component [Streptococcus mutans]|nr:ECF transporter S component [Streptococcus mutans]